VLGRTRLARAEGRGRLPGVPLPPPADVPAPANPICNSMCARDIRNSMCKRTHVRERLYVLGGEGTAARKHAAPRGSLLL
jgi:hypothetical protein